MSDSNHEKEGPGRRAQMKQQIAMTTQSSRDSPVLFSSKSHSSLRRSAGAHGTSANIVSDLRVTCECPSRAANTYVTLACTARYRYKSLTCSALYTQVMHVTRDSCGLPKIAAGTQRVHAL